MKKIFLFLLKKYSQTENDRLEIYKELYNSTSNEYNEQTPYGNIYNSFIEFVMANPFIQSFSANDKDELNIIKTGIESSYDNALKYMKTENKFKK